jgi:hypothetical protein
MCFINFFNFFCLELFFYVFLDYFNVKKIILLYFYIKDILKNNRISHFQILVAPYINLKSQSTLSVLILTEEMLVPLSFQRRRDLILMILTESIIYLILAVAWPAI